MAAAGAMVQWFALEVEALAMRLWASYSTLGPLGLLGAENAPAFQVLPLALRRQVLMRRSTCSLIELCPVQEKGPGTARQGWGEKGERPTDR